MLAEFERVLLSIGFSRERAGLCARVFARNSLDGVYSHGLNRFLPFVKRAEEGGIDIHAQPVCRASFGMLEQWDACRGPGPVMATHSMDRAIQLSYEHGAGIVGLRNTNHWMRAGTYGLLAAEAGCIGICFTNTIPIIPPWGSAERRLGNNPVVFAVPHRDGPILLDMSLAQFSNGKMHFYGREGRDLPVYGGYDMEGKLTLSPAEIKKSRRPLPIGLWKGTGLAFMLDLVAVCLSGGRSTADLSKEMEDDRVSQVFIAMDPKKFWGEGEMDAKIDEMILHLLSAPPLPDSDASCKGETGVRYPGQGMMRLREENLRLGIPVDLEYWDQVCKL
ncbi:MAG: 3-dehydro-L-gulonate 2-dehydrogenase [Spirochaetaceae bacterium]|nr:MAG: 3-dehydro-L-gulonate 2-dehydrogenase [Spirochaetaceae bacterium]